MSQIESRINSIDSEIRIDIEFNKKQVILVFTKPTKVFDDVYDEYSKYSKQYRNPLKPPLYTNIYEEEEDYD